MNYPTRKNIQIISINANPPWVGMFRKAKKVAPTLFFAIGAIMLLASMMKPARPYNQALPIINYDVPSETEDYVTTETSDPVPERPEAQSDVPTLKQINDTYPKGVKELVPVSCDAYITKYAKMAQATWRKYGVPASITLAQGLVEGAGGTSFLAVNANNHFGIKCFSKHCRKGHCINRQDDTHKDFFRKYSTVQACFDDHGLKISTGRYASLKKYGKNYCKWADGLKSKGYATDKDYAGKLKATILRYQLYKYD